MANTGKSNKLNVTCGTDAGIDLQPGEYVEGQRVELLIGNQTEIGYRALIGDTRWGMLYKNEVFQPLRKGQRIEGFIKKVRDDGKIDLCLQKPGHEKIGEVSASIVEMLKACGGFLPLTDQSPAETIHGMLGVSKKTYKKAVGALYKKRIISIESEGIRLNSEAMI